MISRTYQLCSSTECSFRRSICFMTRTSVSPRAFHPAPSPSLSRGSGISSQICTYPRRAVATARGAWLRRSMRPIFLGEIRPSPAGKPVSPSSPVWSPIRNACVQGHAPHWTSSDNHPHVDASRTAAIGYCFGAVGRSGTRARRVKTWRALQVFTAASHRRRLPNRAHRKSNPRLHRRVGPVHWIGATFRFRIGNDARGR